MGSIEAFFLPVGQGARFCLLHGPEAPATVQGAVLFIHPFAEEMNKSRRMAALQARALASAGWTVLQIDLFGCGDSAGELAEATWQRWVDDVSAAIVWLKERSGRQPVLWGLRLGCMIAVDAAGQCEVPPDLLFWQPVASGKRFLQQFLRLKVASQLVVEPERERTGTQQLRSQLAQGEALEVAGYTLSPALADALEAAELSVPGRPARVAWLDVGGSSGAELSPISRALIKDWQDAGHRVEARAVEGPAFWLTQEISECPALIGRTLELLEGWRT